MSFLSAIRLQIAGRGLDNQYALQQGRQDLSTLGNSGSPEGVFVAGRNMQLGIAQDNMTAFALDTQLESIEKLEKKRIKEDFGAFGGNLDYNA